MVANYLKKQGEQLCEKGELAEKEHKRAEQKVRDEEKFKSESVWNFIPIASSIHKSNMDGQIFQAQIAAISKKCQLNILIKKQFALFTVLDSIQDQMFPALSGYIAAIKDMAHIFKELADETGELEDYA